MTSLWTCDSCGLQFDEPDTTDCIDSYEFQGEPVTVRGEWEICPRCESPEIVEAGTCRTCGERALLSVGYDDCSKCVEADRLNDALVLIALSPRSVA